MKVNITCLQGNPDNLIRAKTIAAIKNCEVSSTKDIIKQIAAIYKDVQCPYPFVGTLKATTDGFLIPSIGDKFIWITIVQEGYLVLEDFGAGNNRLERFYITCASASTHCKSIWEYIESWNLTHYKSSIERLVSGYIHYVCSTMPYSQYSKWLGAQILYEQTPNGQVFFGIDMSKLDTTSNIACKAQDFLWQNYIKKDMDRKQEKFVKKLISQYLDYKGIDSKKDISESSVFEQNVSHLTPKDFTDICNDLSYIMKKVLKTEEIKEEFIRGELPLKKVFKGI